MRLFTCPGKWNSANINDILQPKRTVSNRIPLSNYGLFYPEEVLCYKWLWPSLKAFQVQNLKSLWTWGKRQFRAITTTSLLDAYSDTSWYKGASNNPPLGGTLTERVCNGKYCPSLQQNVKEKRTQNYFITQVNCFCQLTRKLPENIRNCVLGQSLSFRVCLHPFPVQ